MKPAELKFIIVHEAAQELLARLLGHPRETLPCVQTSSEKKGANCPLKVPFSLFTGQGPAEQLRLVPLSLHF